MEIAMRFRRGKGKLNMNALFEKLKGGLIVSCQALPEEPLHSSMIMARMARAAKSVGAVGIRANTVVDIVAIKEETSLPILGIVKVVSPDSDVYITPTMQEIDSLVACGVEIIAMDATPRLHTGGLTLEEIFSEAKRKYPTQLFMADCSTAEEAIHAEKLGFDCAGTTLSGYTAYTKGTSLPNIELIRKLSQELQIPVIAEGGIHYPPQLREALDAGAWTAVVGGAITRPQEIAARFMAVL